MSPKSGTTSKPHGHPELHLSRESGTSAKRAGRPKTGTERTSEAGNPAAVGGTAEVTGWRDSTLGEEIALQYGKSLRADHRTGGPFNVYGSNGIVGHHVAAAVEGPGIIVGRKGSVGEVAFSRDDFWPIDTTYYVENKRGSNWLFLYYLLTTSGLGSLNSHSAVPGLNRESVYPIRCQIPPKPEQEKIAAVLWKLQCAIATQDRLIAATGDLKQSAMQRLFTHGLRGEPLKDTEIGPMPGSWSVASLGDFGRIGNGSTPKKSNAAYWQDATTPWLTSAKVHEGIIYSADQFVSELAVKECHLPVVPAGSLLIAITGQGKTLGNSALVEFDTTINQHLAYVRFDRNDVVADYVYQFMRSRYEELQSIGRAGGSTKAALTCAFLRDYRLPLPAPDEQRDIAAALATIDRKLAHHRAKRAALDALFQTTLHQLMTAQIRVAGLDIDTSEVCDRRPGNPARALNRRQAGS